MMKSKLSLLIFSSMLVLSACSSDKHVQHDSHDGHAHGQHQLQNGDIQEETASVDILPSFLDDKPEEMKLIYAAAGKAADLLEWMPCYCGCGNSAGHLNNKNCFVHEIREDGTVVWDDHGTRCLVCMEIVVESVKLKQDGKTVKEVREAIDQKYNEGYASPTNTPMPS